MFFFEDSLKGRTYVQKTPTPNMSVSSPTTSLFYIARYTQNKATTVLHTYIYKCM